MKMMHVALAAALALVVPMFAGPAAAMDKVRYILPVPPNLPSAAPLILAKHLGYFKDEGIDVEFLVGKGGVDGATQVGAGNAEFSGGMGDTSMIVRANKVPVRAVMLLGDGGLMALATRKDAGIESPKDLKGKSVSVLSFQDTTYYALLGMLASQGLSKADVDIQALGPAGMTQTIVAGKVPAMAALPDFVVTAEDAGTPLTLFPAQKYTPSMAQAVIASDKVIAENPDLVRRFVAATRKAFLAVRDDPAAMAKAYVEAVPAYKDKQAYIEKVFRLYGDLAYGHQKVAGAFDPATLAKLQDFYVEIGILRGKTPVEELYTNAFIPAAPAAAQAK